MSNHGNGPFDNFDDDGKPQFQKRHELFRKLMDSTADFRGALGDFPEGKLQKDDEGSIQFAIGEADGKVVIDFGTPVHWLGMTPEQAAEFASAVFKRAREAGRKTGKTITLTIG